MNIPACPECDQPMEDANEGYARLRWGEPCWECHTPGCPRNPDKSFSPNVENPETRKFSVGEKVEFVKYPSLRGVIREILPAEDDLPETVSVDMFIPAGDPGFRFTGITENFWCDPVDLRVTQPL